MQAWTVFLHVDWTEDGDPRFAEQTCFGDPCLTELCPANPDVRAYALALAQDIAGRGVASVLAESLHHHPLEHGAHHERYFVELGAVARLLLGLCFCAHCLAGARRHGADPEELRARACAEVERALAGERRRRRRRSSRTRGRGAARRPARRAARSRAARPSRRSPASSRAATPRARRAARAARRARARSRATRPAGRRATPAPSIAWRLGVDIAACARAGAAIGAIAYAADPARVELDLAAYRALAPGVPVVAALRPVPPDCDSAREPGGQAARAGAAGADRVDIYHYGLAPLSALDRVREALALAG